MSPWPRLFFPDIKLIYLIRPDIADGQANIDPVAAAQIWMTDIQPLKYQGYQLITPAVAFKADWLQAFFKACTDCTVRIVSYHYVVKHGLNNSFLASLTIWLRTSTLLLRKRWSITLPVSTKCLACPSGWQNLPARSVVTCLLPLVWRLIE